MQWLSGEFNFKLYSYLCFETKSYLIFTQIGSSEHPNYPDNLTRRNFWRRGGLIHTKSDLDHYCHLKVWFWAGLPFESLILHRRKTWRKSPAGVRGESGDNSEAAQHPAQRIKGEDLRKFLISITLSSNTHHVWWHRQRLGLKVGSKSASRVVEALTGFFQVVHWVDYQGSQGSLFSKFQFVQGYFDQRWKKRETILAQK